ncbi:MAG: fdm [Ilumatobacteraceae bacterium]|nr:fdm [Ilumatobacteraceae bacterium]
MRAATWQGVRDVRIEDVDDPKIEEPTDAIIKVTSSGLCGSDLHLYEVLSPFMTPGDVLGHEPMGIVQEVGSAVTDLAVGDRVVVPFQIACGTCYMCDHGLQTQCETTQIRDEGTGAALFGFSKLYGAVAGGQAEYLRVPQAQYGPIKVPDGPSDDRFLFLSDVLPTAWQSVEYADIPDGGTVVVMGLGPIGEMATRIAQHRGHRVIAVDLVSDRLERARSHGVEVLDWNEFDDLTGAVQELTGGRGPDAVIDAVGMEASGSPTAEMAHKVIGLLPRKVGETMMKNAGLDHLSALHASIDMVRRGGTISLIGVYGGAADPMPMLTMFDKQVRLHMGQANVKRWVDDIMPLLTDDDPLGVDAFASHHVALEDLPAAYDTFQKKEDGAFKYVVKP